MLIWNFHEKKSENQNENMESAEKIYKEIKNKTENFYFIFCIVLS